MSNAQQTPLVYMLDFVPQDAVFVQTENKVPFPASTSHPVGRLCHEASARIKEQDAELTALRAQVEALRKGIKRLPDEKIMELFDEQSTTLYGSGTAWGAVTRHECVAFANAIIDEAMKGQS